MLGWIRQRGNFFEIRSFSLRLLLDLQFKSIVTVLRRELRRGKWKNAQLMDVGSGTCPYRSLFGKFNRYLTVDPQSTADYGRLSEISKGESFDLILLLEVLEHVADPAALLREAKDYLKSDGELWVSVPFAARVHKVPDDYHRWTDTGLRLLAKGAGFKVRVIENRGTEVSSICAKLCFLWFRCLRTGWFTLPAFLLGLIPVLVILAIGHLSLRGVGSSSDPLGYFMILER